jgi:hypothetical protein
VREALSWPSLKQKPSNRQCNAFGSHGQHVSVPGAVRKIRFLPTEYMGKQVMYSGRFQLEHDFFFQEAVSYSLAGFSVVLSRRACIRLRVVLYRLTFSCMHADNCKYFCSIWRECRHCLFMAPRACACPFTHIMAFVDAMAYAYVVQPNQLIRGLCLSLCVFGLPRSPELRTQL